MKSLQTIQFLGLRPRPLWGLAALCCMLPLLAWQGFEAFQEGQLMQSEKEGLQALSQRNRPKAVSAMTAADRQRHAQIDALANYLATPWGDWLDVFEVHATDKGTVRQIEEDARTGVVKVTARSSDSSNMMAYLMALQADPRLSDVRLVRNEWLRNEAGTPIQFDLAARFAGEAAPSLPVSAASKTEAAHAR